MRHRRQRRRGTLQRGPLSRCGFTSFLKGAAERLRRVFASPTPCTRPHAQSIRAGTRLGPEVLIVARRAATGAQSMHFVRGSSHARNLLIVSLFSDHILRLSRVRVMQCINSSNLRGNLSDISRHQSEHHNAPPRGMLELSPPLPPILSTTKPRPANAARSAPFY